MFRYKLRTLILVLALVPPLIGGIAYVLASQRPIAFDSVVWTGDRNQRPRMVADLLANHSLIGIDPNALEARLGPADSRLGDHWLYWAGTDGVIDDMWLDLTIQGGKVVAVKYYPD